jgi:hypothetical protein
VLDRKAEDGLKDAKIKIPVDLALIIDDVKVCGRGEL